MSLPDGRRHRLTSRKRCGAEREIHTSGPFKNEMPKKQANEVKHGKTDKRNISQSVKKNDVRRKHWASCVESHWLRTGFIVSYVNSVGHENGADLEGLGDDYDCDF